MRNAVLLIGRPDASATIVVRGDRSAASGGNRGRVAGSFPRLRRRAAGVGFTAAALAASLTACGGDAAVDSAGRTPTATGVNVSEESAKVLIQNMADAKADALASGDARAYGKYFRSAVWPAVDPALAADDPAALERMAAAMARSHMTVVDHTATVTALTTVVGSDEALMTYTVEWTMWFAMDGVALPQPSEERMAYLAKAQTIDGTPIITELRPVVESGSGEDQGNAPGPVDLGLVPTAGDDADIGDALGQHLLSYQTNLATAYADKYALSYNSAYRTNPLGGDCANFVSQSLFAAKRPFMNGSKDSNAAWWYDSGWFGTQSYTWGGAKNLFANLTLYSYGMSVSSAMNALPGDLIFADWQPDNTVDHAMIVSQRICSGTSWGCVLIDQHTNDYLRRPMNLIVANNPTARFYIIRPSF